MYNFVCQHSEISIHKKCFIYIFKQADIMPGLT